MALCYKFLDLPKVPQEFVDLAFDRAKEESGILVSPGGNRIYEKNGEVYASRRVNRYELDDAMGSWVSENISPDWVNIGVARSNPIKFDSNSPLNNTSNGPHTDVTRSFVLMYLLEQSNPDQHTIFWQEPNKPLVREHGVNITNQTRDVSNLIEVDRFTLPLHTWVYCHGRIIHSAENIKDSRLAIHIGFDLDPFDVFTE
jgi:hypothetical protein